MHPVTSIATRPESTYKSGKVVQTSGATSGCSSPRIERGLSLITPRIDATLLDLTPYVLYAFIASIEAMVSKYYLLDEGDDFLITPYHTKIMPVPIIDNAPKNLDESSTPYVSKIKIPNIIQATPIKKLSIFMLFSLAKGALKSASCMCAPEVAY